MKKGSVIIIAGGVIASLLVIFSAAMIIRRVQKDEKAELNGSSKIARRMRSEEQTDDDIDTAGIKNLRNDVTDFDNVILRMYEGSTGDSAEYRIFCKGDTCNIYIYKYEGGTHQLIYTGQIETTEAIKLLNECDILSWDGIKAPHGKKNFEFSAIVNGKELQSKGALVDCPQNKDIFCAQLQEWTELMET